VPKVQLLRFHNLNQSPEVLPPGDLRLWKALSQSLAEVSFLKQRVLCVEWPDSMETSRLPDLSFWNERVGIPGILSLALSAECEDPCLQRRRLGSLSSEFETLADEMLREAGYKERFEVWEACHFEMQTKTDLDLLEESVQKLLMLESRSGLLDKDYEDIRFVRPGESWEWSRRNDMSASISLNDLLGRFKAIAEPFDDYDAYRRPYLIREQQPRGPAQLRQGTAFRDRLAEIQLRDEQARSDVSSSKDALANGVISSLLEFHRFADPAAVLRELRFELRKTANFSDDDIGALYWLDVPYHQTVAIPVSLRKQNFRKGGLKEGHLFALNPIHGNNALLWRRLEAALDLHKDLFSDLPWIFSGRETWLANFRNLMASHSSWEMSEKALRQIFAWESERAIPQEWLLFPSVWNEDRVRDALRDFGFEVTLLGAPMAGKDNVLIKMNDGSVSERSWLDVLPEAQELATGGRLVSLAWTAPDLKTPTYGFEKVSIFPDQFLLRLTKLGAKGVLSRKLGYGFRSSSRAREVSMRSPLTTPLSSSKWLQGNSLAVDSVIGAAAAAVADPKAASIFALETCYRNLVARGVDPRSTMQASFFLNKPVVSNSAERDSQNFASYVLAAEGFFETLDTLSNIQMNQTCLARGSSGLKDYECEPVVHMRGTLANHSESVLPGFRMNGEVLYSVGPRPAFMDIGSSILQHVRVVSNHVTRLNWTQQLELYDLIHRCIREKIITDLRPIMWGGISEALLEMALWSGIGVQLKPSLSTIELFSAAPGRFLVGILPQEAKRFEALVKSEWLTHVGVTSGEKLFGLQLERYHEEREAKV